MATTTETHYDGLIEIRSDGALKTLHCRDHGEVDSSYGQLDIDAKMRHHVEHAHRSSY